MLDELKDEAKVSACVKFIAGKLKVKLGSAQQAVNLNDQPNLAVVFDMRTQADFLRCRLKNSINIPADVCPAEFFLKWNAKAVEANSAILPDALAQDRF